MLNRISPTMTACRTGLACLLAACVCTVMVGCGGQAKSTESAGPPTPLSVEQWKQLPVSEKYDETSFDRLRDFDPKLKNERAWARFMREVVVPERKQDIPSG